MPSSTTLLILLAALAALLLTIGRGVLGWICVVAGAILTISPLPFGFLLVAAGVLMLGPRDRGLRSVRVLWRRLVRACARHPHPLVSRAGRRLRRLRLGRGQARRVPAGRTQG